MPCSLQFWVLSAAVLSLSLHWNWGWVTLLLSSSCCWSVDGVSPGNATYCTKRLHESPTVFQKTHLSFLSGSGLFLLFRLLTANLDEMCHLCWRRCDLNKFFANYEVYRFSFLTSGAECWKSHKGHWEGGCQCHLERTGKDQCCGLENRPRDLLWQGTNVCQPK